MKLLAMCGLGEVVTEDAGQEAAAAAEANAHLTTFLPEAAEVRLAKCVLQKHVVHRWHWLLAMLWLLPAIGE